MQPLDLVISKTLNRAEVNLATPDVSGQSAPPVNVIETDTAYFLEVAVPGYQRMNLSVKLEDEVLEVKGSGNGRPYRNIIRQLKSEFSAQPFTRIFLVPGDVKEVVAWFESGVLSIQMLKSRDRNHIRNKEVLIQ